MTDHDAYILRENTGTTGLVRTARDAASILAHFDFPHLIVGGFAVQEHGYPRLTLDLDIVVPHVLEAAEFLTSDVTGSFAKIPGAQDRVKDNRTGITIDLLPAGKLSSMAARFRFPPHKKPVKRHRLSIFPV